MKLLKFFLIRGVILFIVTFCLFSIIRTKFFKRLKKNSSPIREFLLSIFISYIAVMLLFLFTPNVFIASHGIDLTSETFDFVGDFQDRLNSGAWGVNFYPFRTIKSYINYSSFAHAFLNIAGNILLFVPFGFLLPMIYKEFKSFKNTVGLSIIFSFFIEFIQFFIGRSVDIDDLLLNTVGGIIGFLIFICFRKIKI